MLEDITRLVTEIGDRLDVIMVPKVEGAWDIHYVDRLLARQSSSMRVRSQPSISISTRKAEPVACGLGCLLALLERCGRAV